MLLHETKHRKLRDPLKCWQIGHIFRSSEMLLSVGRALPAGTPPHLAEVAIALWAECDPDVCFESGVELILKGADAALAQQRATAG